jgi:hypothetical protein
VPRDEICEAVDFRNPEIYIQGIPFLFPRALIPGRFLEGKTRRCTKDVSIGGQRSYRLVSWRPLICGDVKITVQSFWTINTNTSLLTSPTMDTQAGPVTADFSSAPPKRTKIVLLGDQSVGKTSLITRSFCVSCHNPLLATLKLVGTDSCMTHSTTHTRLQSELTS